MRGIRRSTRRYKDVESPPEGLPDGELTDIYSPTTAGLATPDVESWHNKLELLATELASELISKHELIDVEVDTDNIDEFVNETLMIK